MCNICRACKAINIERKTYYNWLKKFPIFKQRVEEVKESLTDMVEKVNCLKKVIKKQWNFILLTVRKTNIPTSKILRSQSQKS